MGPPLTKEAGRVAPHSFLGFQRFPACNPRQPHSWPPLFPFHVLPPSNRAYLLLLTPEAAELYATRRADFARDDQGEGEVEGSASSEGALAAMRAVLMDPLQVRPSTLCGVRNVLHAAVERGCCQELLASSCMHPYLGQVAEPAAAARDFPHTKAALPHP